MGKIKSGAIKSVFVVQQNCKSLKFEFQNCNVIQMSYPQNGISVNWQKLC